MLIDLDLYARYEAVIRRLNQVAAMGEAEPLLIDLRSVVLMWPPKPIEIPRPRIRGAKYLIFLDGDEIYVV